MITNHILSIITFLPLLAVPIILLLPKSKIHLVKWVALAFMAVVLVLSFYLYSMYDVANPVRAFSAARTDLMFKEDFVWIKRFNIHFLMAVDGISLLMVILTTIVSFVGVIVSFGINKAIRGYFSLYMLLYVGMMGVFVSFDFFLFYIFWEIMLLPMYFLIGIWGGPRKEYAAIKFFLYTLFGSVFMLLVMISFYLTTGTFNLVELSNPGVLVGIFATGIGPFSGDSVKLIAWIALFLGFAIKIPAFPFHTWLPDAHVEAPTAISVILAGVLLKMGTYGIIRIIYPILPAETVTLAPYFLVGLGVINIIYGALAAMAQTDLKKMIAYSSVSHMGFVMLGMGALNTIGVNGAVLQMFNHGTITAMLFILVGVVYDRAHHRNIDGFGGIASVVPKYTAFTAFAFFAALGLPGLSGFISEAMCFMGGFQNYKVLTMIAVSGVIFTAAYLLWAMQRVFLGEKNEKYADLKDISKREVFSLLPVGFFVVLFGIYPMPILNVMSVSVEHLLKLLPL